MRICVISSIYGRRETVELAFRSLKRLFADSNYHLTDVVIAVSEDWAVDYCLDQGFIPVYYPNEPLSDKMNAAFDACMLREWDYLLEMDSDTLFCRGFWDSVKPLIGQNFPIFGFSRIYMVEKESLKAIEFNYMTLVCAGRFVRRDICEKVDKMWPEGLNKGLGNAAEMMLMKMNYSATTCKGVVIIDLKSNENIWTFDKYENAGTVVDLAVIDCPELDELVNHKIKHNEDQKKKQARISGDNTR